MPLHAWAGDRWAGIHWFVGSAGWLVGNDRLRAGPHLTLGLLGTVGAGGRIIWEPMRVGSIRMGPEVQLTLYAPGLAEVMWLWGATLEPAGVGEPDAVLPCEQATFGLGAAGSVFSTEGSWEYVGTSVTTSWRAGPAMAATCELRDAWLRPFVGFDTAPWTGFMAKGVPGYGHLGAFTGGVLVGNDTVRGGVHTLAGALLMGAGARLLVTPWEDRRGLRWGGELRANVLVPGFPVWEGHGLVTVAWAPG